MGLRLGAALLVTCAAVSARAYPQYIAKGATTCGSCHYSPTGGGFPTAYGHATLEATLFAFEWGEELREHVIKNDLSGYNEEGAPALQASLGVDVRGLLFGEALSTARGQWLAIPMLTEIGGVVAYGPWLAYAGVTLRPPADERSFADYLYSREHWVGLRLSDTAMVRAGRLVKPFGLRIADHTQFTRAGIGLDMFSQSYGVEIDWSRDNWVVSLAGMAGGLVPTWGELEPAAYVSATYSWTDRAAVGGSFGAGWNEAYNFAQASVHTRMRLWQRTYVLAELATRQRTFFSPHEGRVDVATYLRAGWFVLEALDLYLEGGQRFLVSEPTLVQQRYSAGLAWHPLPWMELIGTARLDEQGAEWAESVLLQVHLIY